MAKKNKNGFLESKTSEDTIKDDDNDDIIVPPTRIFSTVKTPSADDSRIRMPEPTFPPPSPIKLDPQPLVPPAPPPVPPPPVPIPKVEKKILTQKLHFSGFYDFPENYKKIKHLLHAGWKIQKEEKTTTDHFIWLTMEV